MENIIKEFKKQSITDKALILEALLQDFSANKLEEVLSDKECNEANEEKYTSLWEKIFEGKEQLDKCVTAFHIKLREVREFILSDFNK